MLWGAGKTCGRGVRRKETGRGSCSGTGCRRRGASIAAAATFAAGGGSSGSSGAVAAAAAIPNDELERSEGTSGQSRRAALYPPSLPIL